VVGLGELGPLLGENGRQQQVKYQFILAHSVIEMHVEEGVLFEAILSKQVLVDGFIL
jgi:hypothetical protein